ncbi:MAG: hypothetical protein V7678_01660 [Brevundimonas sp.]
MRLGMSVTLSALLAATSLAACSDPDEPVNDAVNEDLNTDTSTLAEGANSFTEDQARGHVENAGYENVSSMTMTENGVWQGTATRGGETRNVSVDYRGAVAESPEGAAAPTVGDSGAAMTAPDESEPATAASPATMSQDPADMPGATSAEMRQTGERG